MDIKYQLKQLLKWDEGETFYSFANADGKRWWMPARHMAIAMNLYQPSGLKGKLLKQGLPWLYWNPVIRKVLHAEQLQITLGDELRSLLEQIFKLQGLEFSIFGGTPSVHQKITMQISLNTRILGYVKITDSEAIYRIFEHEKQILNTLHKKGVRQIPDCLYCGTLKSGSYIFVQSTVKTQHSEIIHKWSNKHEQFLKDLDIYTRQEVYFEDSDFCRDLNALEKCLPKLGNPPTLYKTLQEIKAQYTGKQVVFSTFQADFTPWNMFVEKGRLFVFDWEYARLTYPPRLDYFHFLIQTAVFEEHLSAKEIWNRYVLQRNEMTKNWENPDLALQCYLLSIISVYVQREHDALEESTIKRIGLWLKLLNSLKSEK